MASEMTRRTALKASAAGVAATMSAPRLARAASGDKMKVGVIGVGGRGRGAHIRSLLNIDEVEVAAICDISQESIDKTLEYMEKTCKAKRKPFRKPQIFKGGPTYYKKMLDLKDLTFITQATPCNWHAPMFLDTLAAGKHLYAEKPLGITVKELDECVAASKANPKLIVTLGYQWMYHPSYIEAVERVQKGEIGPIVEARVARHNGANPLMGWFSHRKTCGDWMLEQACHEFNVINWITKGHPLRAFAIGRRDIWTQKDPGRNVTDFYSAVLEYPNNVIVNYSHDWHSPPGYTGMELKFIGSKGAVNILGKSIRMRGAREDLTMKADLPRGVNDTQAAFNTFVQCIKTGKQPLASPEYGRLASHFGLMLRKSVDENGRVVTYEEMLKTC